jgi:hypothetical protein
MSKSKFPWTKECDNMKVTHEYISENGDLFGAVFNFDGCVFGLMSDGESYVKAGISHSNSVKSKNFTPMHAFNYMIHGKQLRSHAKRIDPDRFEMSTGVTISTNKLIQVLSNRSKLYDECCDILRKYLESNIQCRKVFSTMDRLYKEFINKGK